MMTIFQEGFETGEWSHDVKIFPVGGNPYETEVGNIFTPEDWLAWFLHDPGIWDQPEGRNTWGYVDPHRIHSGDGAYMLFSVWRHHDCGLMRQAQVAPGTRLRLTAWAHAWSNHSLEGHEDCCDDGRCSCGVDRQVIAIAAEDIPEPNGDPWDDAVGNSIFVVGIDPNGGEDPFSLDVEWGPAFVIYNGYAEQLEVEAVAGSGGTVTVFLRNTTFYSFKHNDGYWDDVVLETVDDEPPSYESTMLVLPQDATPEQLHEIFTLAYPDRRTFGFSHDDAGHLNGTAVLYNIPSGEVGAYLNFYWDRYPGVVVKFDYTSDWGEPELPVLWQCDPEWGDEKVASPSCSMTLCQTGCWISDCAMAQRFLNIKPDATPSTANKALGAAGGFSGCMTLWNPMKSALGLEVVKRSYDDHGAREWLDAGNVLFAEVEPDTFTHFVLVTRYSEGRFWMHDPYKNIMGWVDEYYDGIESWRLVRPAVGPPPPPPPPPEEGTFVSLHMQSLVDGIMACTMASDDLTALRRFELGRGTLGDLPSDLQEYAVRYQETLEAAMGFVERTQPRVIKIFQLENAERIKALSPNTIVVLRYFTGNQDLSGNLQASAQTYVDTFRDSLEVNHTWIDKVESFNETVCSNNADSIRRAVEFDYWFAESLMALGLPGIAPQLLNVAVGNPLEREVELLLPAVRQVIKYDGTIGYHGYGQAVNGSNLNDAWEYLAGRALEGWDPVFRARGLYPKYILGECGAFATCVDGWRANNCLNGNWPLYLAQLQEFSDRIKLWNAAHGNRCLGGTLFTVGGWSWDSFEIRKAEMEDEDWPV